jgi:hypothetical protein
MASWDRITGMTSTLASEESSDLTVDALVYFSVVEQGSVPIGGVITAVCEGETQDGIHEVATSDGQRFLIIFTDEQLPHTMGEILRQIGAYSLTFWLKMYEARAEDAKSVEWKRPAGMVNPLSHWPSEYRLYLQNAIETTCMTARSEYLRRLRSQR